MTRFQHIALNTPDIERSVEFYSAVFGFKEFGRWKHGEKQIIMLRLPDGVGLELHSSKTAAAASDVFWHISFDPDDVDECCLLAQRFGAVVDRQPFSCLINSEPVPLSARVAWLKGPFGESIELFKLM